MARTRRKSPGPGISNEPLWHKDAIIYQTHVRAFVDSNGDGTGDFHGLTSKLDYLQDLGITAMWILPFYPSPLRDDGYDIADYTAIHPSYGTMRDFQQFMKEAHHRGIRVITELVLNHTSDQHAWFQRAREAKKGSRFREYYVWNDTPDRYTDARIIFKDFETSNWTWDNVAQQYFWHRFYSHQPDLNFESAAVRKAVTQVLDTWLDMGVDGLRLDALPYLYESEGTSCENLPATHGFLQQLRSHVDRKFRDRVFLAEANQWPDDAAAYFGSGDECHMAFHFPLMPRLFMALNMEDRFPVVDILEQTPQIPDTCQWALFLRNHDELTLEMVTDAERDYMYRTYARDQRARINLGIRRRLAPLLSNNRRKIELMNSLLFSLPGSPIIYYGDELGMGDNVYLGDRNGVRTPMQWSPDRNAGFSKADPQSLYLPVITSPGYHFESVNVEVQQSNPTSLLWWMKRLISVRKRYKVFGRGTLEFLHPENPKIIAYIRKHEDETVLIVANLSRFVQSAELDLHEYAGHTPVEIFGLSKMPAIDEDPYFLTMGPHGFYWFELRAPVVQEIETGARLTKFNVKSAWTEVFEEAHRDRLERVVGRFLKHRRWFGGKARVVREVRVDDAIEMPAGDDPAVLLLVTLEYAEGEPDTYQLCLALARGEQATIVEHEGDAPLLARVHLSKADEDGVIYDALFSDGFSRNLIDVVSKQRTLNGGRGKLKAAGATALRKARKGIEGPLQAVLPETEQSNSSILYTDQTGQPQFMLKLFRRLEHGENPDVEMVRFLSNKGRFPHVPDFAGSLTYEAPQGEPMTVGLVQKFVPNESDAWKYTISSLSAYFDSALTRRDEIVGHAPQDFNLLDAADEEPPTILRELIGPYLDGIRLLGRRTGEMHNALASDSRSAAFAPERLLDLYRQALHHEIRSKVQNALRSLQRNVGKLGKGVRAEADELLERSAAVRAQLHPMRDRRISAKRIRIHGDYHLGQVLHTGKDFVIIDFEGEPARPLSERRLKRCAMQDVAGMLRSFHYSSRMGLIGQVPGVVPRDEDLETLTVAADLWYRWVAGAFLRGYFDETQDTGLHPKPREDLAALLDAFLLDKAAYELLYELNNRPDWTIIPVRGLLQMVEQREKAES